MRKKPNPDRWPSWRYGPNGESAIFKSEAEVPYGWTRKPGDIFVSKSKTIYYDRKLLEDQLRHRGIEPHASWSAAYMKEVLDQ